VFAKAGINTVPFEMDLNTLLSLSASVSNLNFDTTPLSERLFAFYEPSELLPFLPSSYSESAEWLCLTDPLLNSMRVLSQSRAVSQNLCNGGVLRGIADTGAACGGVSDTGSAPVGECRDVGGKYGRHISRTNTAFSVSISQLPAENKDKSAALPLTVYPLAITASCTNPQLAADFASFIALDTDAILLTVRLEGGTNAARRHERRRMGRDGGEADIRRQPDAA
jgi:hypothetical protein